jgi:hypothetical protein
LLGNLTVGTAADLRVNKATRRDSFSVPTLLAERLLRTLELNKQFISFIQSYEGREDALFKGAPLPAWAKSCPELPAFSRTTSQQWWQVALHAFDERFPKPEHDTRICNCIQPYRGARKYTGAEIRSKIKSKIKRSFLALAR